MNDFSWNRACRLPWVSLTAEERAAGWPAALTLENFASMQFPMEGDESARRTARKDRAALLATMREAIAARKLDAEERRREVQREVDDSHLFEPIPLASSPRGWFERARGPRPQRTITEIETRHAITRDAAAEFLAAQGIAPSEHIAAWIRPLEQAEAHDAGELTPLKRAAIIERLGRKYQGLESALNRGEAWAKACRVPKRNGWYYLERIEDECRARYGAVSPAPAADLSPAGQLRRFVR